MSDGFYVLFPNYLTWPRYPQILLTWTAPWAWGPEYMEMKADEPQGNHSWWYGASVAERWHYLYLRWLGFELSISW